MPINRYEKLHKLGEGAYGAVYKAKNLETGRLVALKYYHRNQQLGGTSKEALRKELEGYRSIRSEYVIKCHGFFLDEDPPFLELEYADGGTLGQELANSPKNHFGERKALETLSDCLRGLQAVHEQRLLHRDLAPRNIFLFTNRITKIGDLGVLLPFFAGAVAITEELQFGTPSNDYFFYQGGYTPPEIMRAIELDEQYQKKKLLKPAAERTRPPDVYSQYTKASDVYSIGAIFYECLTGKTPNLRPKATRPKFLCEGIVHPKSWGVEVSRATLELLLLLLAENPTKRESDIDTLLVQVEEAKPEATVAGMDTTAGLASENKSRRIQELRESLEWLANCSKENYIIKKQAPKGLESSLREAGSDDATTSELIDLLSQQRTPTAQLSLGYEPRCLEISHQGNYIAVGLKDGTLKVMKRTTFDWKEVWLPLEPSVQMFSGKSAVRALAFLNDSTLAASTGAGNFLVFERLGADQVPEPHRVISPPGEMSPAQAWILRSNRLIELRGHRLAGRDKINILALGPTRGPFVHTLSKVDDGDYRSVRVRISDVFPDWDEGIWGRLQDGCWARRALWLLTSSGTILRYARRELPSQLGTPSGHRLEFDGYAFSVRSYVPSRTRRFQQIRACDYGLLVLADDRLTFLRFDTLGLDKATFRQDSEAARDVRSIVYWTDAPGASDCTVLRMTSPYPVSTRAR